MKVQLGKCLALQTGVWTLHLGDVGWHRQGELPPSHSRLDWELKQTCSQRAPFQGVNDPEAQEPPDWHPLPISMIISK